VHPDQLGLSIDAARALIDEQFPQWRGLPLREVRGTGTVNAIVRIGAGLAARFPLRGSDPVAVRAALEAEAAAARELAACSPVPTPVPVAIGEPGAGYPLPWSVQTWLPGRVATPHDSAGSMAFARDLAAFISALRAVDTRGRRFTGAGRGGDLRDQDAWMQTCFRESERLLDVPRLRALWSELRELPSTGPDVMSHHDLIPGNVLVRDGRLAGVLDGGAFGPADPALDLVAAWHLLDDAPRAELRRLLGCGDVEWERGRAWAFAQAMGLVWYYVESNPVMSELGRSTLARLAPPPGGADRARPDPRSC
jgi:aminoglycoside phosphotransferase (APT) family kinase protein